MFFFHGSVATGGGNGFASWSCSQPYLGISGPTFHPPLWRAPHSPVKDLSCKWWLETTHKKESISHRRVICWCFWSCMRFMFFCFFCPASLLDWAMIKHVEAFNQLACFFGGGISYHFWWGRRDWWYIPIPLRKKGSPKPLQDQLFAASTGIGCFLWAQLFFFRFCWHLSDPTTLQLQAG